MRVVACTAWIILGVLMAGTGCLPPRSAAPVSGVALQPGRYLEAFYQNPEFVPGREKYLLEPFNLELAGSKDSETFQAILQEELRRAWEANGLKLAETPEACRVSGTVHRMRLGGGRLRFLFGKIYADLSISGQITQGEKILFAFQDRIHITSPVKPGAAAPKETELLLRQAARTFAAHLLTEMLLQGLPAAEG
jgi:hypothetical protein